MLIAFLRRSITCVTKTETNKFQIIEASAPTIGLHQYHTPGKSAVGACHDAFKLKALSLY